MASSFYTNILNRLIEIRDERATHANTATRVGTALIDMLLFFVDGFLSRTDPDTAQGKITFADGAKFGDDHGIDANGDATLHNVAVANDQAQGEVVATFGNTKDSLQDGTGTLITDDGRVQTTKMEVRGTLTVLDLIASQIHSLDGYYYFSDTMKIETVTKLVMEGSGTQTSYHIYDETEDAGVPDEDIRYLLTFEKEYDNDFLKFYDEDVILSIATDIEDRTAQREVTEGGNTGLHDITSWSWMHINATTEQDKQLWADWLNDLTPEGASNLGALVTLYPNDAESGVVGNTAPQEGKYVTRRGNRITDPESPNYKGERQNSWCISVEEGRLTYYINQTTPTTGDENYGIAIGKLPDIKPVSNLGLEGEIGIYAKNLLVENLYTIRWAGNVKRVTIDKGKWSQADAANGAYFYKRDTDGSSVVTYTNVQVTHNGCVWQSTGTRTTDGTTAITSEPVLGSTDWVFISGQTHDVHYYATTETKNLDEGGVDMGADPVLWKEDQSYFLFKTISGTENPYYYCALRPYMWRKTYRYAQASDDIGDHYEDEVPSDGLTIVEEAHLIGVYGETGVNYICQTEKDYIAIDTATDKGEFGGSIRFYTDNGGVRNAFPCYCRVYKRTGDTRTLLFNGANLAIFSMPYREIESTVDVVELFAASSINASNPDEMVDTYLIKKEIPLIKAAKGDKGDKGDKGLAGPVVRVHQNVIPNGMNFFDGTETAVAVRYKDYIVVGYPQSLVQSGYMAYECIYGFHYQSDSDLDLAATFPTPGELTQYLTTTGSGTLAGDLGLTHAPFQPISVNALSAFFTYLIAQNAYIRMLTGSNFVITDNVGTILAGMGNRVDGDGNQYYLWSGGQDADSATFKVFADGRLSAVVGEFSGLVKSRKNVITKLNVAEYTEYVPDLYHNATASSQNNYDPSIVGTGSAPSNVSAWVACFRGVLQFKNGKLGQNMLLYATPNSTELIYQGSSILKYPQGYPTFDLPNYMGEVNGYGTYTHYNDNIVFNLPFFPNVNSDYHTMSEMDTLFTVDNYRIWKYLRCCANNEGGTPTNAEWASINAPAASMPSIMGNDIEWQVWKLKWMGEMLEAARSIVGCKITIRACTMDSGQSVIFRGVCRNTPSDGCNIASLIDDYEWSPAGNIETSVTLECKEFTFRGNNDTTYAGIAWFPTTSNYGYYDRYTIGLPDINE